MDTSRSRVLRAFHRAATEIEGALDKLRYREGRLTEKRLRILTYAGYRSESEARLSGRVVEYREPLDPGTRTLTRLRAMLAIYESDEVPDVAIRLEGYGGIHETKTDSEGYFDFRIPLAGRDLPAQTKWEEASISAPDHDTHRAKVAAPVLAPGRETQLGIISDIDDTVVETGATNFLKNWRRVLVHQPEDRLAVPGASKLYRMLVVDHQAPRRPVFYVSSSPWNLYGFITEFMELNEIPHGPMFLKDYGIDRTKFIASGHGDHKLTAIETILAFYPGFKFLLIGDNGQKDVDVYAQVVEDYPDNVAGVFIRDIAGTCREGAKGERLAAIEARGVPVYCGEGFGDAMAMVAKVGFGHDEEATRAAVPEAGKAASTE